MIRRMVIKFSGGSYPKIKEEFEDAYQAIAVRTRLKQLVDAYGDMVINRVFETGKTHYLEKQIKVRGKVKTTVEPYGDMIVYYNDNYENIVMKCLRPYWAI